MAYLNSICSRTSISTRFNSSIQKLVLLILTLIVASQEQCCLKFSNSKCIQCPTGTRLYMGHCLFDIHNCLRYSGGFYCTKCEDGYELMDDNTCMNLSQNYNLTEADIPSEGYRQLSRAEMLSEQNTFNKAMKWLTVHNPNVLVNQQQIIKIFTRSVLVSTQSIEVFRVIAQTDKGFDDILFTYNSLKNISSVISQRSFNKLSENTKYEYVDLKSKQVHEFIMWQISGMDEFIKKGKSVFDESEELIAFVVKTQVGNMRVDSFLIYFANRDHGLIEVGFDLEVYQKQNSTEGGDGNNIDETLNQNNGTTTNGTTANNSTSTNNTSNNNNNSGSHNENTQPESPINPSQPTNSTNSSIVYLRSLLSIFNFTLIQNYTSLPDDTFASSPLAPKVIDYLLDNHPTLAKIYHTNDTPVSDYLVEASYKLLTVKQILIKLRDEGSLVQQTIDQFDKDVQLDLLVCLIFRLTYEIDQLQPYQIKILTVMRLNDNKILDHQIDTHMQANSSSIQFIRIVDEIGRPQTTYIDQSLIPPSDKPTLPGSVISYPPQEKEFIQRVQFFLEIQYPEVMEGAQLMNVTYQEFNKASHEIRNLSAIKNEELRRIEQMNSFRQTYRVYVFTFERMQGQVKTEYKWKVEFKDNQLQLIEVPKQITHPFNTATPTSQPNTTQPNNGNNNSHTNNNNNPNRNNNSHTQNNHQSLNGLNQSTLSNQISQQEVIFSNLFVGEFVSISDKYIIQLDRLVKSFYSGLLNSNNSSRRYSLVLVGQRSKYQVNTTLTLNPDTNITSSNVAKVEQQKLYNLWYLITKFNRNNTNPNQNRQLDNEKVFGFELGVSMRGLVTLYKVNTVRRGEFAHSFQQHMSGKINNNGSTSFSQPMLRQVLLKVDKLQPNLQSFNNYLKILSQNTKFQSQQNNSTIKADSDEQLASSSITGNILPGQDKQDPEINQDIQHPPQTPSSNSTNSQGDFSSLVINQSQPIFITQEDMTNQPSQSAPSPQQQPLTPQNQTVSTTQQSIVNQVPQNSQIIDSTPSQPPSPLIIPINVSFSSMSEFRKWDNNTDKLIDFIQLIDPTKQSITDKNLDVIYRIEWKQNYLRYLVIFKNITNSNKNQDNSQLDESSNDSDDNKAQDVSALNFFELEIEKAPITNSYSNSQQLPNNMVGEVVILSINDQKKQNQYQKLIEASSMSPSPVPTNPLGSSSSAMDDYYYYSSQSAQLSTSIIGAAEQQAQRTQSFTRELTIKNRVLQQLLNEISTGQLGSVNSQQQDQTPSINLFGIDDNQYPSMTSIKGQSVASKENLRKQPAQPITKPLQTPKSTKPNQIPTRKWLGLLKVSAMNKSNSPSQNIVQKQEPESISFFSRRFYQNPTLSDEKQDQKQLYQMITVLLQLPSVAHINNMSQKASQEISNSKKSTEADTTVTTHGKQTLTLSLRQFIVALSMKSSTVDNNRAGISNMQFPVKVQSSSFLNRQMYRFGQQQPWNKKIDQFISSIQNDHSESQAITQPDGRFITIPKHISALDPYFQASQRFVIWDNAFFLKKFAQKQVKIHFDNTHQTQTQSNTLTRQQQFTHLTRNLQSYNSSSNESVRHLAEFQSFMARNFKHVVYTVHYMIANYQDKSVDDYVVTTEYNQMGKRYDVTEFRLVSSISLQQIQAQQKYRMLDPTVNCQTKSQKPTLECLKCQEGYLLTDFYELFGTSQDKPITTQIDARTVCSKQIPNCKYQFMEMCVQCEQGYDKVDKNDEQHEKVSHECVKNQ